MNGPRSSPPESVTLRDSSDRRSRTPKAGDGPDTGDTNGPPRRYGQRASAWTFTGRRWKANGPRCPA